jgi:hypothetical protein
MFRISSAGQEPVVDVDDLNQIEPAIRTLELGRYHVGQIEREPLPSGNKSRRWETGIKRANGSVAMKPYPWELR